MKTKTTNNKNSIRNVYAEYTSKAAAQNKKLIHDNNKLKIDFNKAVKNANINLQEASGIYEYIQLIEKNGDNKTLPYPHSLILKVVRCNKKIATSEAAIAYYKSTKEKENANKDLIFKHEQRINALNILINDYKESWLSKFHSKYINKLNKHKKTVVELKDDNTSINLSNVCKYYYNKSISFKVLEGINLKIMKGEFAVILGPSGSGKTTLLNIISGMDSATYGQVDVCGTSLVNLTSNELTKFRKDNVGYIFQQYGLLPNLTVRENVEIGSSLQSDKSQRLDIDTVLKDLGIFDFKNKMPYELSGGQQQRVSIARSVAKNPRIIFADEPTGAIDEKMSKQIMQMLVDINKKYKTTVIIVTHNPIIAELATKIIIVENGDISKAINNKPKSVDEIKWSMNFKGDRK